MKLLEKLKIRIEGATAPHGRNIEKPNEDRMLYDEENRIIMLLDGVTRPHAEYIEYPYESAALDLGNIFIEEAYGYIKSNINAVDPESILRGAVRAANLKIRSYREKKSEAAWSFYPSTLGIIGIIRERTLHFVCVGDSIAVLLRRDAKILFGREWTLEAVDKLEPGKAERYAKYCNHPKNPLSYTVFNGDDAVMEGLKYSFVDLHEGDVLLLASDGVGDYIKYEKNINLIFQSPAEMIANSTEFDKSPFAAYADDKTVIKISL